MNTLKSSLLVLACLALKSLCAQENPQLTSKDSIVESSWMFGLGYNFVDDSGDVTDNLFNFDSEWNSTPYPNRISIGRYFKSGIGLEAIATYNRYREGKRIDNSINLETSNYFGIDSRLTYDLNKVIGETKWFDPYLGVGIGYTDANNQPRGTYNAVVGFRTWISDKVGLDFNSSGKWSIGDNANNHLQHAAGVVYRFGIEKQLSKKGIAKLALIQTLEKEKQRALDSITNINKAKEQALLAERLAQEKEKTRLAAVEKSKQEEAKNTRRNMLQTKIKDYGLVHFSLNSSYINKKSKRTLDSVVELLKENPGLRLTIGSYTDSRGSLDFNNELSKKRVENTSAYLIKQGIESSRLVTKAYGEEKLLNECEDGVYCSESKHQMNRRSEFIILEL